MLFGVGGETAIYFVHVIQNTYTRCTACKITLTLLVRSYAKGVGGLVSTNVTKVDVSLSIYPWGEWVFQKGRAGGKIIPDEVSCRLRRISILRSAV